MKQPLDERTLCPQRCRLNTPELLFGNSCATTNAPAIIGITLLCLTLAGCSSLSGSRAHRQPAAFPDTPAYDLAPEHGMSPARLPLLVALRDYYSDWAGVPYRYGGTSRNGIDCSAFVKQAMATTRGLQLPRSTGGQARHGHRIARRDLRIGDLVFFHTGSSQHVGIYVGNNRFMHASTKVGVTVSSLDNVYWRRHYWQARRIS